MRSKNSIFSTIDEEASLYKTILKPNTPKFAEDSDHIFYNCDRHLIAIDNTLPSDQTVPVSKIRLYTIPHRKKIDLFKLKPFTSKSFRNYSKDSRPTVKFFGKHYFAIIDLTHITIYSFAHFKKVQVIPIPCFDHIRGTNYRDGEVQSITTSFFPPKTIIFSTVCNEHEDFKKIFFLNLFTKKIESEKSIKTNLRDILYLKATKDGLIIAISRPLQAPPLFELYEAKTNAEKPFGTLLQSEIINDQALKNFEEYIHHIEHIPNNQLRFVFSVTNGPLDGLNVKLFDLKNNKKLRQAYYRNDTRWNLGSGLAGMQIAITENEKVDAQNKDKESGCNLT